MEPVKRQTLIRALPGVFRGGLCDESRTFGSPSVERLRMPGASDAGVISMGISARIKFMHSWKVLRASAHERRAQTRWCHKNCYFSAFMPNRGSRVPFWLESWAVVSWTFRDAQSRSAMRARDWWVKCVQFHDISLFARGRYVSALLLASACYWILHISWHLQSFWPIGSSTPESNAKQMGVLPGTGHWDIEYSQTYCCSSSSGGRNCDLYMASAR